MEASAIFGRRWFLALALRQVPEAEETAPDAPANTETDIEETDECAS